MTEERTDLERQLRDIQKWEKAQQRAMFWQTFTRLPFQLLDKLTPQFIQRKIGLILDETGTFIQSGGQYLTSEKRIMKSFKTAAARYMSNASRHPQCAACRHGRNRRSHSAYKRKARRCREPQRESAACLRLRQTFRRCSTVQRRCKTSRLLTALIRKTKERVFIVKLLQLASSDVIGKSDPARFTAI